METVIGKGAHGTIYEVSDTLVRKESCNSSDCHRNRLEYDLQEAAHTALEKVKHTIVQSARSSVDIKVPKPHHWVDNYRVNERSEVCCSYDMERIYSPEQQENTNIIWQLYLYSYEPNYDKLISDSDGYMRGRYVGYGIVEQLVSQLGVSLKQLSYLAGCLLSAVQYGSKQTAVDTELVLGTDLEGNMSMYLIDYDRSTFWSDNNIETGLPYSKKQLIYQMVKPLEDEEFYPGIESELRYDFIRGYLEIAEKFGHLGTAKKVLELRESMERTLL